MTRDQKIAIPLILGIVVLPLVLLFFQRSRANSISYTAKPSTLGPTNRARIVYEPVALENIEEWEVITDPVTGIPLKVVGHRRVSYG